MGRHPNRTKHQMSATHHIEDIEIESVEGQTWGFALISMVLLLLLSLCLCFRSRRYLMRSAYSGVHWGLNFYRGSENNNYGQNVYQYLPHPVNIPEAVPVRVPVRVPVPQQQWRGMASVQATAPPYAAV